MNWQGHAVEVKKSETLSNTTALVLWALVPAGIWAGAMKIIGDTEGYHSTPGIWGAMIGFPGIVAASWIYQWTNSEPASYLAAFLGNWLFWFALIKVAVVVKHRLNKP